MTLRIRNLSAQGLGGDRVQGMTEGETLILTLRGIGETRGRVAWVAGSHSGFAFDHAIDPTLIRTPPANSAAADRFVPSVTDSYRRLGLKPRQ
ncbi:hypothetical protein J3E64_002377 [Sphingobium sp. OAS761]|uniref:hypothetical protein n=1 Tax=Sphingobium sp. OAS761 TaxID=2817901 RepID=UPI00209EFB73|nr:hypothetical protein [Sphingobium sp. OAS761]MCP1470684.1 hypothetical protein [Sphingobium sp. OAS761]